MKFISDRFNYTLAVTPRPERVYGTCNCRVVFVHENTFFFFLSAIVVFLEVVFKDEIVRR